MARAGSAVATVSVNVDASNKVTNERMVDPKQTIQLSKRDTSVSTENMSGTPSGEPGAVPNMGLDLNQQQQQSAGTKSTSEKTDTENAVDWGSKQIHTQTPAGDGIAALLG